MTGKELKKIRASLGWTQDRMGKEIGYAHTGARMRVCELENGRREITHRTEKLIRYTYAEHITKK